MSWVAMIYDDDLNWTRETWDTWETLYVLHLAEVREHVVARLPLLIGSGVTLDNVDNYANAADALIVGSYLKIAGRWENAPDPERVQAFVGHLKGQQRLWRHAILQAAREGASRRPAAVRPAERASSVAVRAEYRAFARLALWCLRKPQRHTVRRK